MKLRVEQPEKWSELVEVAGTALHSAGRYGVDDALRADPDFAVAMVLAGPQGDPGTYHLESRAAQPSVFSSSRLLTRSVRVWGAVPRAFR